MTKSIFDILGTRYNQDLTPEENLKAAGMSGWNIRNVPVYAVLPDRDIPMGRYATLRTNPKDRTKRDVLGETTRAYEPTSNEEQLRFMEKLREELVKRGESFELEHLGATADGKKIFITLRHEREVSGFHLVLVDSHDSTLARHLMIGYLDPRTGGFANVDLGAGVSSVMKLSSNGVDREVTTDEILGWIDQYENAFLNLWGRSTPGLSIAEARHQAKKALGAPGTGAISTATRFNNRTDEVMELLGAQKEGELRLQPSKFDVFLAICAWSDFKSPVRGAKLGELAPLRSEKSLFFPFRKEQAFNALFK